MLLKDALQEFIFECEVKKYTWKTIKGYRNGLEYLINYLQQEHKLTELEEIQTRHLKAYFMWQSKRGRKECQVGKSPYLAKILIKYETIKQYNDAVLTHADITLHKIN